LAPDDEPIPPGVLAEVRHHEVAGLLRRPGPVGICGDAQYMQVTIANLEHEQKAEPL
jgi:hypothetical protein